MLSNIYAKSRPKEKKDITLHRRSGKIEGFRDELKINTIRSLNENFKNILIALLI